MAATRPRRLVKPGQPPAKQRGFILSLAVVLILVYGVALLFSTRGWGYSGYNGFHRGPSYWYWGGPSIWHDPSVRNGGLGGTGHRGGGIAGGK